MRDLFPGHYRLSDEKIKELWENAIFIFDSNVLLNLYSYPEQARQEFFSVLTKIKENLWIPYQVAYEFHKNRFNKIRASNDSVEKLRTKLKRAHDELTGDFEKIEFSKRNTGVFDLDERINTTQSAYEKLKKAIDLVCDRLPRISLDDPIAQEIADLFEGKVGIQPKTQKELDSLIEDAEKRYGNEIPPGFMDKAKGENFIDGDIIYPAKYGDLIIWNQTINYIKETKNKNVIFITGDRKEDWWWSERGEIIGPHPRLISEFIKKSDAEKFWIYTSDKFLEYANTFLKGIEVSKDSIEQVKHASDYQQDFDEEKGKIHVTQEMLQRALTSAKKSVVKYDFHYKEKHESPKFRNFGIRKWIQDQYPNYEIIEAEEVDYFVLEGWKPIAAFEVMRPISASIQAICNKIMDFGDISNIKKTLIITIQPQNINEINKIISENESEIQAAITMSGIDKVVFGYVFEHSFVPAKEITNI